MCRREKERKGGRTHSSCTTHARSHTHTSTYTRLAHAFHATQPHTTFCPHPRPLPPLKGRKSAPPFKSLPAAEDSGRNNRVQASSARFAALAWLGGELRSQGKGTNATILNRGCLLIFMQLHISIHIYSFSLIHVLDIR
ncbi:hypothetical protein mRhiFer1_009066 [Rhinolophus ferrumequinum]|uniref:Uncharacterized protein n=1 Tax=Rhinolophus ferrumequinum TaxID=59479 RepID=A0A7J7SY69_RHIFE|nr:hypothetical protein mRhiFer1_009066 [Rhinolophus ferrumequinum]